MRQKIKIENMKIGELYFPQWSEKKSVFRFHSIRNGHHMFELVEGTTNYSRSTGNLYPLGGIQWMTDKFKYGR